jgi:hypothetical protein
VFKLGPRPTSEIVALVGSLVVAALFAAAAVGVGAALPYRWHGLRFTPFTVAMTLLPVPSIAWIATLWSRSLSKRAAVMRVICTLVLLLIAVASAALTIMVAYVEPVARDFAR